MEELSCGIEKGLAADQQKGQDKMDMTEAEGVCFLWRCTKPEKH